ncbi:Ig-like domain-containing protein [Cohnella xylanilytica]|uniref:Ig-like domain-containing protein n=1 Tax=Cohnella xylanilytica TaxID=557555 RepID=UPI001FE8FCC8|nr:Ig-like domain-containing protein [Cohnella xylanilytica]
MNQPPVVSDDNATTDKDTPVSGEVKGTDPDGDPLTYTKGSEPQHGTVTVNPDGTWTYVPEPGYVGPDSFTVIVDDGKGGMIPSTITVDVTDPGPPIPPNQPPTVPNYNEATPNNASKTGTVVGMDPEGDSLTYTKGSDPQHGTVTVDPDGTWTYVPEPGYVGPDSFTVIVDDGKGGTIASTITIDVTDPVVPVPPNQPPTVPDYNATTRKNSPITEVVEGMDSDGDPLTYKKGSDPQHGTVTVDPDGTWTYTPEPGYVGEDSFTVVVDDGKGGTTTATITIGVTDPGTTTPPPETPEPPTEPPTDTPEPPPSTPEPSPSTPPPSSGSSNQPPAASDSNATAGSDSTVTGTVKGTDPDGDALTYAIGSEPQHGTATVNPDGTWTYVPAPGFVGKDSFTIIVDDGKGGKTTAVITIDVTDPGTPVQLPGTTNPPNPPNPPSPPSATPGQPPSDPTPLPANTEDGTASSGTGTGSSSAEPEDGSASRGAEEPDQPDNRLPSTASNVFNLGLFGAIALLAGLILRRNKNKAQ